MCVHLYDHYGRLAEAFDLEIWHAGSLAAEH